jgi:D-arabinose 1-dehydrogenase-like Zn-dependent alcohol dehydrogenase
MRAVLYARFRDRPALESVLDPDCPPDGVLIDVAATGLCRSDWHGWMGHDPDIRLPHVPGHEFAGVIVEVGHRVRTWHLGDRVTVPFVCACGECASCRRGEQQVCDRQLQPGFTQWGSFAELVAVPRADLNLVRIPDDMQLETAASLGCRFSTAYRAVVHHGRVTAGDWVAVHGCGGVGLAATMIAAAHGGQVVAIDVAAAALDLARSLGATATVDASTTHVVDAVRQLTGGGAHLSLDAFGSSSTCRASIDGLRKRGRHVQVGLLADDGGDVSIPMSVVLANELEIIGSHGMPAHAFRRMLSDIHTAQLDPDALIGRRLGLAEAGDALADLTTKAAAGVTVIRPHL